jgi:undecaprenyl-diphosphatase
MNFIFYLLNFIQAVAEFLPISSSGHLLLVGHLYGISEQGLEAFLHFPTALAIAIVFGGTFIEILKDKKTWPILIVSMVPAGLIGLFAGDYIDAIFYSPIVIGLNQIFWGAILLYTATRAPATPAKIHSWKEFSLVSALKIGFFQTLALIPGTSRSGITTLAGIWQGATPQESARFSFISGFPLIAAASAVGFLKLAKESAILTTLSAPTIIIGMGMSLVLGIFLMKLFTSSHTLTVMKYSGYYRIVLGLLVLSWLS